jgi:alpha-ketoglutarate-dependent taurine dioxygenase
MMKPTLCTLDLKQSSHSELRFIISEIQRTGLGVFFNQDLDESEFIGLMKRIGRCETPYKFMNPELYPEISIVSASKNEVGEKVGMFGEGELGWHSNGNSRHRVQEILIALYCVVGDVNSTLSICHTGLAFSELSKEEQEYYKEIKIQLRYKNGGVYQLKEDDPEHLFMLEHRGSIRRLVETHPYTNASYFYFPYHFICRAWHKSKVIDHQQLIKELIPKIFQSQFQHHVVLAPGDLILMDQLITLHRRSPVAPDRRLWRIACDYSQVLGTPEIKTYGNNVTAGPVNK